MLSNLTEVYSLEKQKEPNHAVSTNWNSLAESSEASEKGSILWSQQQENSTWRIAHLNSTSIQIRYHITLLITTSKK